MHRAAQLLGDTRGGAKQLRHRLRVHKAAQLLGDPGGGAKQLPIWKLRGKVQRSCTLYGLVVPCSPGKALCSLPSNMEYWGGTKKWVRCHVQSSSHLYRFVVPRSPGKAWCSKLPSNTEYWGGQKWVRCLRQLKLWRSRGEVQDCSLSFGRGVQGNSTT